MIKLREVLTTKNHHLQQPKIQCKVCVHATCWGCSSKQTILNRLIFDEVYGSWILSLLLFTLYIMHARIEVYHASHSQPLWSNFFLIYNIGTKFGLNTIKIGIVMSDILLKMMSICWNWGNSWKKLRHEYH